MTSKYGGRPEQDFVVKLDQIPRWVDAETASNGPSEPGAGDGSDSRFLDPLSAAAAGAEGAGIHGVAREPSKFPVNQEANSRLYVWRGAPWPLEVDAVVNSTNEVGGAITIGSCAHIECAGFCSLKGIGGAGFVVCSALHCRFCDAWMHHGSQTGFDQLSVQVILKS